MTSNSWSYYDRLGGRRRQFVKKIWELTGFSREFRILLRFEFEMFLLNLRNKLSISHKCHVEKLKRQQHLKVQLGSGPFPREGWVNIDGYGPSLKETQVLLHDIRKPLPLENNSVKYVFLSHVFEHLIRPDHSFALLREIYRVLEPRGVVRIIVPNGRWMLDAYYNLSHPLRKYFTEDKTWICAINRMARETSFMHKFLYDAETLISDLKECGFENAYESQAGKSAYSDIVLDYLQEFRIELSLYVEAVKRED